MKKNENITTDIISKKHFYTHKIELRIRNQEKKFDFNYINTIIAMTLNHCVKDREIIINGYLITSKALYLLVKTHKKTFENTLNKIEVHINLLLQEHKKETQNSYKNDFITDDDTILYTIKKPFFKLYPLENEHLIQLITGKKVTLPYFDRKLEELKLMIHRHPFCSAIDYSGAIGPVNVTLLNE